MTSGSLESSVETVENKLKQFEKELDDIIEKVGCSIIKDEESIETLNLTYQQLVQMDQQECCILSFKLSQYAAYIQSVYNRLDNIKSWCQNNIDVIVGKYSKNYGDKFTKWEEKRAAIISENTYASALMKLYIKSHGRSQELNTISHKIMNMSNILLELSKSKRARTNG